MKKLLFFKAFFLILPLHIFSQLTIGIDSSIVAFAQKIVGSGVTITNASLTCGGFGSASGSGTFSYLGSTLGLTHGVILTTGYASDAVHPAQIISESHPPQYSFSDANLTSIEPAAMYDNCILQFDFVPLYNQLNITYVFGSSEYDGYQCSAFNDAFGMFLTGPNPAGGNYTATNIAALPNGTPVAINNVNNGSDQCTSAQNPTYYHDNSSGTDIVYEGLTTAINSTKLVVPDSTYHLKVAIADAGDQAYDSGVFIQDSSFSSKNVSVVSFATLGFADTLCADTNTYTLSGGMPSGGTYSGIGVNGSTYNTAGLAAGTYIITYTYIDTLGHVDSATHSITLLSCTSGIDLIAKNKKPLSIYPNPSNGNFSIETNTTGKQNLQIFDINGKLVLNQFISNQANIDATRLTEGVYNISISGYAGVINKRLVIIK
ncbi:MAG TPA: choice-of-anchor L domain-containing protein [Bacteroidia bacterium]|nr:choice-of-anchor L domain-containing protein [Bacteroidia bacterium]